MNANTLKKVHQFGKVGKIVLTVLLVLSIVATVAAALATVAMAVLPRDAIVVTMTNQTSYQGSSETMESMWRTQTGQAAGEGWQNGRVTPFGSAYDTASMHEENGVTVIETTSAATSFNCGDAARLLLLTGLFSAALAAARYIVGGEAKKLFSFSLTPEACRQLDQVTEAFLMTQQERGFRTLDYYKQLRRQSFS